MRWPAHYSRGVALDPPKLFLVRTETDWYFFAFVANPTYNYSLCYFHLLLPQTMFRGMINLAAHSYQRSRRGGDHCFALSHACVLLLQLAGYYFKLRGVGITEPQDVKEISDVRTSLALSLRVGRLSLCVFVDLQGELASLGMSDLEVASLRGVCEFDMVVPDYDCPAPSALEKESKKKKSNTITKADRDAKVGKGSICSTTLVLVIFFLIPIWGYLWWQTMEHEHSTGHLLRHFCALFVVCCYYAGGSTFWRCKAKAIAGVPIRRYRVTRRVKVTKHFSIGSETIYNLEEGDEVDVLSTNKETNGRTRAKLEDGWVSMKTKDNEPILQNITMPTPESPDEESFDGVNMLASFTSPAGVMEGQSTPVSDVSQGLSIVGLDGDENTLVALQQSKKNKAIALMLRDSADMLVIGIATLEYSWMLCAPCTLLWIIGTHMSPHSSAWAVDKAAGIDLQKLIASRAVVTYSCAVLAHLLSSTSLGGMCAVAAVTMVHLDRTTMWQQLPSDDQPEASTTFWRRVLPPFFVAGFALTQVETFLQIGGTRETDGAPFGRLAWLCFAMWFSGLYLDVHSSRWAFDRAGGFDPKKLLASLGARSYISSGLSVFLSQWTATSILGLVFAAAAVVSVHTDRASLETERVAAAPRDAPKGRRHRCCAVEVGEPSVAGQALTLFVLFVIATVRASSVRPLGVHVAHSCEAPVSDLLFFMACCHSAPGCARSVDSFRRTTTTTTTTTRCGTTTSHTSASSSRTAARTVCVETAPPTRCHSSRGTMSRHCAASFLWYLIWFEAPRSARRRRPASARRAIR